MAFFPCKVGNHHYRGPSSALYPARVNGVEASRTHLRLCPVHMAEMLTRLEPHLISDEEGPTENHLSPPVCASCGQTMEEPEDSVFVTAFPRSRERADYWFRLHQNCRLPVGLENLSV